MDDFNKFIDEYEDDLIGNFLESETEKDYNTIFGKWYKVYRDRGENNDISYLLFVYHLINWWFIIND